MRPQLFDTAPKHRRRLDGNLPVLLGSDVCPDCGAPTADSPMGEMALFIHGGYGADRNTTVRHCARLCGFAYTRTVTEANPRHR